MKGAVSIEEFKEALNYDALISKEERSMEIFMVSVTKKLGYLDALNWISNKLPD